MKKRFVCILFALILAFSVCAVSAYADGMQFIFGFEEGNLGAEQAEMLAQEIYDEYGIAVCYYTPSSLGGMTLAELAQSTYERRISYADGILLIDCDEADEYYLYRAGTAQQLISDEDSIALCNTYDTGGETYAESVLAYLGAAREILARVTPSAVPEGNVMTPSGLYIPAERQLDLVVDAAGALTTDELTALNEKASSVSEQYSCDVAVVFVTDTGGKDIESFAFNVFDMGGYGYGENDDGVMLVVDTVARNFQCITHSFGAYAFTDAGQEYIDDYYIPYLKDNDWAGAADAFISAAAELLAKAREGTPVDVYNMPKEPMSLMWIVIDLIIGFVLSLIPISILKKQLKTVNVQRSAQSYVSEGSFYLSRSNDRFIHRSVSKTPRPKPNDNNHGGGGGGTSFHTSSSSGRSFGSHGGSF